MKHFLATVLFFSCMITRASGFFNFPDIEMRETYHEHTEDCIVSKYSESLGLVIGFQEQVKHLHPFLNYLYPVAIVENESFYLFDLNEEGTHYVFILKAPLATPIPEKIRAAFPLNFYENQMACIVTGDVFDSIEGIITIFHEFIHCHQWNTVEQNLRKNLPLAQKSMEINDFMWEINYPFPYVDPDFEQTYSAWLEALNTFDNWSVSLLRNRLKEILSPLDFQYMVWQEWKEGFALFIENKIRKDSNLEHNRPGIRAPFNRLTFYSAGSVYINHLIEDNPTLSENLEELFYKMLGPVNK